MSSRMKRAAAWLPLSFLPIVVLAAPGVGCELIVDVNPMLVDGSPTDVVVPTTLDGYACPICRDASPDADFDGDEMFPAPKDSSAETSSHDATDSEAPTKDGGLEDSKPEGG